MHCAVSVALLVTNVALEQRTQQASHSGLSPKSWVCQHCAVCSMTTACKAQWYHGSPVPYHTRETRSCAENSALGCTSNCSVPLPSCREGRRHPPDEALSLTASLLAYPSATLSAFIPVLWACGRICSLVLWVLAWYFQYFCERCAEALGISKTFIRCFQ